MTTRVLWRDPRGVPGGKATPFGDLVSGITLGSGSHQAIEVRAPFTGAIIGTVPASGPKDVQKAISAPARRSRPGPPCSIEGAPPFFSIFTICCWNASRRCWT
jgi:hypothetical protein